MHNPISKYSLHHPLITPEFFLPSSSPTPKVKALLLYDDISMSPDLIYDDYQSVLDYTFSRACIPQPVVVHPNYHMYVDELAKLTTSPTNVIATQLYRLSLLNTYGIVSNQTIHGPVALFGSLPAAQGYQQINDYSVPYELVEQVVRMYKNYVQN